MSRQIFPKSFKIYSDLVQIYIWNIFWLFYANISRFAARVGRECKSMKYFPSFEPIQIFLSNTNSNFNPNIEEWTWRKEKWHKREKVQCCQHIHMSRSKGAENENCWIDCRQEKTLKIHQRTQFNAFPPPPQFSLLRWIISFDCA